MIFVLKIKTNLNLKNLLNQLEKGNKEESILNER